jgi:hypothetical protein
MPTIPASRDGGPGADTRSPTAPDGAELHDPPAPSAGLPRIEALITQLVRTAPALDPTIVTELVERLHGVGPPHAQPLARAIAAVVALVAEGRIDAGIALPALAMACATLADGVRGAFTERELEAARYEIETLLPLPVARPTAAAPDVPLAALRKRAP